MSYNADVYRKVGRGGAGNFYSKPTDSDETNKDLEAQQSDPSTQPAPAASNIVPGQYARAGRGGAGNFFDPTTAREQQNAEETITAQANANANAGKPVNRMALGGRGGAGNYHQKQQEDEEKGAERETTQDLEKNVQLEVDEGLKMPDKALLGQDRK